MVHVIQQAQKGGMPIGVTSETTKRNILQTARIMGIRPPEVAVLSARQERLKGITLAAVIVDYP